jgi:hypothetical protein
MTEDEAIDTELAPLETVAEILAYTYRCRGGEPTLREIMDRWQASDRPLYRDDIEQIASEIAESGMKQCAKIVAEYAAKAEPDMRHYECPHAPDTANFRAWLQRQKNRYPGFDVRKVVYPQ